MKFDIKFIEHKIMMELLVIERPRPASKGRITIGSFVDDFYSPLDVWQCSDYERQWENARARLRSGAHNSCFVICVHPPEIALFIESWIFWRLESEYRIQNQCFFFERTGQVDPRNPYEAIWPYSNVTEDGERIDNDWGMPLDTFSDQ